MRPSKYDSFVRTVRQQTREQSINFPAFTFSLKTFVYFFVGNSILKSTVITINNLIFEWLF